MIAEVAFETDVLRPGFSAVTGDSASVASLDATDEVALQSALWLSGTPRGFADALSDRHRVAHATRTTSTDSGTLYHVRYTDGFGGVAVYRNAVARTGTVVDGRAGPEGWTLRLRLPDRDGLGSFREDCATAGVQPDVTAVHEAATPPCETTLTGPQREVLTLAVREGYFEVPREASLADIAAEVGVSSQAASERLRRGLDSLVARQLSRHG
jgi:hypothetical protein